MYTPPFEAPTNLLDTSFVHDARTQINLCTRANKRLEGSASLLSGMTERAFILRFGLAKLRDKISYQLAAVAHYTLHFMVVRYGAPLPPLDPLVSLVGLCILRLDYT